MRASWITGDGGGVVLHPMTSILIRHRTENRLRGGEGPVKTQVDIGTRQSQAKEPLEHQTLEEASQESLLELFGEV